MRWLAAHTWLLALVPLVTVLVLCYYTAFPVNLLSDSEVPYLDRDTVLCLHLLSEGQERAKTIRYTAQVEDGSKVLLYLQKDSLRYPELGDVLLVQTTVRRGGMSGDFDYGRYLRLQGLAGSGWAHRGNWQVIGNQPIHGVRAMAERCQHALHERYKALGIHGQELGIVSALTLGYREELDKQVQQSFSAAGAMHILAVSGLHTGVMWGVIMWLLTLGGLAKPLYDERGRRWAIALVGIAALWVYAFVTGLSPSVMRSALMVTLIEISYLLRRPLSGINCLSAAAVIILLVNPLSLWSVSFQLSFAAMAGLLFVARRMQQRVMLRGTLFTYIGGLLLTSVAAQIGTAPLTLHYFGQTSNYFALTNIAVIPMAFVLFALCLGALALSWCVVGTWIGTAVQGCAWLLRRYVEWIESLPYSTTQIDISTPSVFLLYGAITCGLLMMRSDHVHWWWLAGVIACMATVVVIETGVLLG